MIKKAGLVGLACLLLAGEAAYGGQEKKECQLKEVRCEKTAIGKTSGLDYIRGQCKKPIEGISFQRVKTGEDLLFPRAGKIKEGKACGWRSYEGTNYENSPEVKIINLGDPLTNGLYKGIRIEYTHPEDDLDPRDTCKKSSWIGVYHPFRSYDCGYEDGYRCANLLGQDGIKFLAQGNGKLRVQLTEGYEGCVNFGEAYESLVNLTETWQEYKMPFSEFSFRKDWQMGEKELRRIRRTGVSSSKVSELLDCQLDLGIIQALTLEGLYQDNDQKCRAGEKMYFEVKDIKFY
jgi:hypothetical protein